MNVARPQTLLPVLIAACGLAGAVAPIAAQTPQARPAPAAAAGGAERPARPATRRPVTKPLGDGPWDFETEQARLHVTVLAKGLDHPWGLALLPDGGMLVTERPGRLRVIRDGKLDPQPIEGLPPIRAAVIGGLMDVVLHPDFERNRLIYFSYSKPDAKDPTVSTLAVARARWDGGPRLEQVEDIFVAPGWYGPAMAAANHRCCGQGPADGSFGGRMVFGPDGLLYVTSGDRNWGEKAQDPGSDFGKILRIRDDGTIPADNPFVGKQGYRPEIFTLGHRNPTGLTLDRRTGQLWSTEFGPRGGDELNRIEAGKNYGWILVTEGAHYNGEPVARGAHGVPGMQDPVVFWAPSINPGNLAVYRGDRFPAWRGDILIGTMTHSLLRVRLGADGRPGGQEKMLTELGQRLRDVREAPDGSLYLLTDEKEGAVLHVDAAPAAAAASARPDVPAAIRTFMSAQDVAALVEKAKADRKGDQPLVAEPILSLAPYRGQLEYRPALAPAALHEKDAELMYVLEGTGNIVTGGRIVDAKRTNAFNLSGPSIEGGHTQALVKGDFVFVPEQTPHQVEPTGGAPIVLFTMHVPRPVDWQR